ncbi:ATP binding domain 4 [Actinomortierella wolfii]|nr:ATP binding domain 4 [Actinomortierella wolfii]
MKVIGLISGGKDSFYNLMQCVANGHDVVALANLRPRVEEKKDELDSYMYQTVGHDAIHLYEECMGLPLYRREIHGSALQQGSDYVKTEKDETEDLYELLKMAKEHHPDLQAVSVGAILSNYQRVRVENVCSRLGLVSLSYLWQRNQEELLWEMAQAGVNAVLVKVAAIGLKKQHLGRSIGDMYPYFCRMNQEYDLHICGEGGEYETLTIDCPLFRKRIVIKEAETVIHSDDAFAQVAYLRFKQLEVEEKDEDEINQDWIAEMNLNPQWDADNIMQPIESHVLLQEELSKTTATTSATVETTPSIIIHEWEKNANLWTHAEEALAMSGMRQPMFKISSDNVVCAIGGTHAYETDHDRHMSIAEETSTCLDNVMAKLLKAGLSWQEVVFMQVYVSDMANFGVVNNAYKGYFGINPPPRACVGARLPGKRRIQVSCLAIRKQNNVNGARQTMHVQGMSYWAPANIGPYSQATTHSHHTFIAGQIGMIPSTLDLPVPKSLTKEVAWSLRNLKQIAVVQQADLQHRTALCIAFVDHPEALSPVMSAWSSSMADKTAPPPLLGVCMPSLPKGAQVEWQVLIHDGKVYADREAKQVADGDGYDTDDDDAYQLEKRALKPVVMELHHEMAAGPRNSQDSDNVVNLSQLNLHDSSSSSTTTTTSAMTNTWRARTKSWFLAPVLSILSVAQSQSAAGTATGLAAPLLLSSSHGRQWIRDMLGMLATAVDRVLEQHRTPARGPGLQRPGWGDVVNVTVYYLQDIVLGKDVAMREKLEDEGASMDDEAVRAELLEAMVDDTLSCIAGIEYRQHGQQGIKPHPGPFAVTLVPVRAMSDHGLLAMTVHAVGKIPTRPGLHS